MVNETRRRGGELRRGLRTRRRGKRWRRSGGEKQEKKKEENTCNGIRWRRKRLMTGQGGGGRDL